MRLTPENKQKITERIRNAAAIAFRAQGYNAVNLDLIMKHASLTRGAFYAHYASKADLFADVMQHEHPVLQMLKQRRGTTDAALRTELLDVFHGYLTLENLDEVFVGCSLASLTGDTARAGEDVRQAYGKALKAICFEMARGTTYTPEDNLPALLLATGAVRTARAAGDPELQAAILSTAWTSFQRLLPQ